MVQQNTVHAIGDEKHRVDREPTSTGYIESVTLHYRISSAVAHHTTDLRLFVRWCTSRCRLTRDYGDHYFRRAFPSLRTVGLEADCGYCPCCSGGPWTALVKFGMATFASVISVQEISVRYLEPWANIDTREAFWQPLMREWESGPLLHDWSLVPPGREDWLQRCRIITFKRKGVNRAGQSCRTQ